MRIFDVYTMDGESFAIEMEGFSITEQGNGFELMDSLHGISNAAVLAFNEIAAIIPREQKIRPKAELWLNQSSSRYT
jgi:hypothetical protein